jgi:hypothetical protein
MEETKKPGIKINKAWILVAFLVIVTGVLLVVSLTSKYSSPGPSSSKEFKKDFAHTSLEFSNDIKSGTTSAQQQVDINIITNGDKVTMAQLEMSYDPKLLTNVNITSGEFIKNAVVLQKNIDTTNGRIKYWIGIPPNQKGLNGKGIIATVSFTKIGSSPAQINFMPKTSVSASGIDQSVLKSMISGLIRTAPKSKIITPIPTKPTIVK